jgi:hypothetical protein
MSLHKSTVNFQEKQIETRKEWYIITSNKNRHATWK